jgi:hypothetical protein
MMRLSFDVGVSSYQMGDLKVESQPPQTSQAVVGAAVTVIARPANAIEDTFLLVHIFDRHVA